MPLILIIFLLIFNAAQPAFAGENYSDAYHADRNYCISDGDCAVREGLCGPEIMNIHFDNSDLIRMQALVKCLPVEPPAGLLKCDHNKCVATPADALACPKDARMCPDGTTLSRIGPDCEFAPCPQKRPRLRPDKYHTNMLFCRQDTECGIREGACGLEVMNIYFDNGPLIASRPHVECAEAREYRNPRCESKKCVADPVPLVPNNSP